MNVLCLDWCAVCHDGGDTLYCCDRCPKVFHLYCYIPKLDAEPADDWTCLMCETRTEIFSLSVKVRKGRLSERDLRLCRRLLLEMYNMWPESVPFRDCADLNFASYLEVIKVRKNVRINNGPLADNVFVKPGAGGGPSLPRIGAFIFKISFTLYFVCTLSALKEEKNFCCCCSNFDFFFVYGCCCG